MLKYKQQKLGKFLRLNFLNLLPRLCAGIKYKKTPGAMFDMGSEGIFVIYMFCACSVELFTRFFARFREGIMLEKMVH